MASEQSGRDPAFFVSNTGGRMAKRATAQPAKSEVAVPQKRSVSPSDVPLMAWETGERKSADITDDVLDSILEEADEAQPAGEAEPEVEIGDEADPAEPETEDEVESEESEESEDEDVDEAEAEATDEPAAPTHRVKVNGEEIEVPLPELIAGYSRESDYRQKTQALAEQRRQTEAERAQYAEKLAQIEALIAATQPPEPDWDALRKEDPAEYAAAKLDYEQRQKVAQAAAAERQRLATEQQAELLRTESEKLLDKVPEWKDRAKYDAEATALRDYAVSVAGLSEEEAAGIYDHRAILLLRKAKAYDDLQQQAAEPVQRKIEKAKVLQPGGKTGQPAKPLSQSRKAEIKAARERLAHTGSASDASSAIALMLGDDD